MVFDFARVPFIACGLGLQAGTPNNDGEEPKEVWVGFERHGKFLVQAFEGRWVRFIKYIMDLRKHAKSKSADLRRLFAFPKITAEFNPFQLFCNKTISTKTSLKIGG